LAFPDVVFAAGDYLLVEVCFAGAVLEELGLLLVFGAALVEGGA